MDIPNIIKKRTVKLRHNIVKFVAPKLYADYLEVFHEIIKTPRPMTLFLKDYIPDRDIVGVEVGVAFGDNALSILEELPIKHLFLVDPYLPYMNCGYVVDNKQALDEAKTKISRYSDKVTFVQKKSLEALGDIGTDIDFIYLDGDHNYDIVKREINAFYQIIRPNGVLGGHDYTRLCPGVVEAVNEFSRDNKLHRTGSLRIIHPDWLIVKPT
jgi:hypothetical protein